MNVCKDVFAFKSSVKQRKLVVLVSEVEQQKLVFVKMSLH